MAKFVIECPFCHTCAEAKTGFFARKTIDCVCGRTINVRTNKMSGHKCPHCGNMVVFDQSEGKKAKCPVCHEPINTMAVKLEEFSCAQCGIRLCVPNKEETYKCPVCDYENDVRERLTAERIKKDVLPSVIKYEGNRETLVWKHPIEDFNMGSQLIVHESQEAIFFKDGQALDLFGAGRYTLETQKLPMMDKLYNLPTNPEGIFHSEVYYINLATQMGIKWGTDTKVRLFDPASGLHVELGASGEFNIRVTNSRKLLLKVVGTTGGLSQGDLLVSSSKNLSLTEVDTDNVSVKQVELETYTVRGIFRAMIMTNVKSYLAQAIKDSGINILEIDAHLLTLSQNLRDRINIGLNDYGLTMPEFFISRIVTPDGDSDYQRMKKQYAEQYLLVRQEQIRKSEAIAAQERKAVEAQTAAQMKIIGAQGEAEALKIQRAAEAEAYKMQAEAEAAEMRMKGYTYQQESARQVGLEAMKNGITGGGGSVSALGHLAGLGVGIGAMSGVIGMTKEAMMPAFDSIGQIGQGISSTFAGGAWDCVCGQKGIVGNFCFSCGAKRSMPNELKSWDCACGQKGITTKFCSHCGAKQPISPELETGGSIRGCKGISENFHEDFDIEDGE